MRYWLDRIFAWLGYYRLTQPQNSSPTFKPYSSPFRKPSREASYPLSLTRAEVSHLKGFSRSDAYPVWVTLAERLAQQADHTLIHALDLNEVRRAQERIKALHAITQMVPAIIAKAEEIDTYEHGSDERERSRTARNTGKHIGSPYYLNGAGLWSGEKP